MRSYRQYCSLAKALDLVGDRAPDAPPITIEVRTGDQPMLIETVDGEVRVRPGASEHPDAVLTGPPRLILGVLTGRVELADARARGLELEGEPTVLDRVRAPAAAAV